MAYPGLSLPKRVGCASQAANRPFSKRDSGLRDRPASIASPAGCNSGLCEILANFSALKKKVERLPIT